MLSVMNLFVKGLLPQMTVRKLSKAEKEYYGSPYKSIKDRKAVRQWPIEVPISGTPTNTYDLISDYHTWLVQSELPKLLFHAQPGAIITPKDVKWLTENLKNLKTVDIGDGMHYIQEDNPHKIGEELASWMENGFQ